MAMKVKEYLETVLRDQTLASNGEELTKLEEEKQKVEALLRGEFEDSLPEISYGGSRAKMTMIKAAYDLDLTCYFSHDEDGAGETLKEIYDSVKAALDSDYFTEPKTSAIRLRASADRADFHIDVVPGRFVEDKEGDVFIHQATAEKGRLKTNLKVHIEHIRDSDVTDAIRLIKLWRERNGLSVKTFVLELLVVDLLKNRKTGSVENQLKHVWTEFRDDADSLTVEDPANPSGNDLTGYLDTVRSALANAASVTLTHVEADNWKAIFGKVQEDSKEERVASLGRIAATVTTREKPWCRGQ
jgi:hypothetical protein